MKVTNVKVYDLDESIIASGYPMMTDVSRAEDEVNVFRLCMANGPFDEDDDDEIVNQLVKDAYKSLKRAKNLASTGMGEGHNQFLTGIRVNFDLTFTNKAWVELERYRFLEFVSSQSTMHRIAKFNLKECYNEYVDPRIIDIMNELKDTYNKTNDKEDYLRLLYSNPAGFELTARLTTNYRCLKTVYAQRKNHRLPEWRLFCKWIETLPYAKELILNS